MAVRSNIDPGRLEPVFVFHRVENYIACSPSTDAMIIAKLQSAFESIKTDNTLSGIWKKYEAEFRAPANG